jgi:thiol-disulfide isomerase/thioredoxin
MATEGSRLIFFSGRECPHCRKLRPVIEQAAQEMGKEITELEVWHNDGNANLMRKYGSVITKACGGSLGVPALYNEKTGKALCGMLTTKEMIIKWANE